MGLKEALQSIVFLASIFLAIVGFSSLFTGANVTSALILLAGWMGILFHLYIDIPKK